MTSESVLIIEEDTAVRATIETVMSAAGYDVRASATPEQALSPVGDAPAVAVVSFGAERAEEFVRGFAQGCPDTELILLANPASIERLIRLYDLPTLYNHRWKPLDDVGELARDVARALERRALKRQNAYLLTELRDTRDQLRDQAEFMVQVERMAASGRLFAACSRVACARGVGTETYRSQAEAIASLDDLPTDWIDIDLVGVIDDACLLANPLAGDNHCRILKSVPDDCSPIVGFRPQILQALLHVILNALDAMPDGGYLQVALESTGDAKPGARITIRDTGVGIQPHVLPRVFEPFFTTGQFGRHTGLGLWAARSIVRQHDGEITIDTAVGRGTTVTLWFPAAGSRTPNRGTTLRIAA